MRTEQLITSLGAAMQDSFQNIELYNINGFLKRYFEPQDKNNDRGGVPTYQPQMIRIQFPQAEDKESLIDVPIAALCHHDTLNLHGIKLRMNVQITEEQDNSIRIQTTEGAQSEEIGETQGRRGAGEIELEFLCRQTPEGIARIETKLNQFL